MVVPKNGWFIMENPIDKNGWYYPGYPHFRNPSISMAIFHYKPYVDRIFRHKSSMIFSFQEPFISYTTITLWHGHQKRKDGRPPIFWWVNQLICHPEIRRSPKPRPLVQPLPTIREEGLMATPSPPGPRAMLPECGSQESQGMPRVGAGAKYRRW